MKTPNHPTLTRRALLQKSAMAGAAMGAGAVAGHGPVSAQTTGTPTPAEGAAKPHYCLFTKHLLGMEPAALADHVAALGFSGVEAPVRPGGHVEPARAAEDLPAFVETLGRSMVKTTILTTAIDSVSKTQHTETLLRTAAALGVRYYRMNWFQYDLKKPLPPQLADIAAKVRDLIALSKELGIQPLYQNHHGRSFVGAAIWDIESIMREFPPQDWGFAYDIMHGSIVGGTSWEIGCQLAQPRIHVAYFKDFQWIAKLKPEPCPLGEGMAAAAEYARLLKSAGFHGPISLHIEYLKAPKITSPEDTAAAQQASTRDLAQLKRWWEG